MLPSTMRKRHESGGRPRGDTRDKLKTLTAYVDQALEGGNVRIRPLDLPSESRLGSTPSQGSDKDPLPPDLSASLERVVDCNFSLLFSLEFSSIAPNTLRFSDVCVAVT